MRRKPKNDAEHTEIQRLKASNQKLRRQVSRLKKVISKFDLDTYLHVKELMDKHDKEDQKFEADVHKQVLHNKWECYDCEDGILRIVVVSRLDGAFYFRKCDSCNKRTKTKKHTDSVEGV